MKSTQRHAALAAGFFALVLGGAPAVAAAQPRAGQAPEQRGGPPGPDTKGVLVSTFRSDDRKLGVEAADAVRRRLQDEYSMKVLHIIPKKAIDGTLEQSGYKPDSALSVSDLMELAKQVRADYVIDASASKVAEGVRVDAKLLLKRGPSTVSQPLAPAMGKDAGAAAKEVHKALAEALKVMPAYVMCDNNLRAQKFDQAAADGRGMLTAYPSSSLGRLCLLLAFTAGKAAPDSIIRVANEIATTDPTNVAALSYLADAYNAKGDKEKAIETMLKLWRADPTNATLVPNIIQALGQSGAPDKALPIVDELLKDNPTDTAALATKWKLLSAAKRYKEAIKAGEEWAKADPSAMTLEWFNRQFALAAVDSNNALALQYLARAVQKFPKDAELRQQYASALYKAGQLQQALSEAQQVVVLNPKATNAFTIILVAQAQTGQVDSAVATAQKAIAAGVDKATVGDVLAGVVQPAVKKAQETKTREEWQNALKTAQGVDQIAPSATTKYFIGVSAFQIAQDVANSLQELNKELQKPKGATAANKSKACEESKVGEDALATASVAMPAGASVDKNSAGQIMGAIQQYLDFMQGVKKQFCK